MPSLSSRRDRLSLRTQTPTVWRQWALCWALGCSGVGITVPSPRLRIFREPMPSGQCGFAAQLDGLCSASHGPAGQGAQSSREGLWRAGQNSPGGSPVGLLYKREWGGPRHSTAAFTSAFTGLWHLFLPCPPTPLPPHPPTLRQLHTHLSYRPQPWLSSFYR